MHVLQRITRQAPDLLKLSKNQCRTSYIGTPPRVRISFTEKVMLGTAFYIGVMFIPMWVTFNVKNYNAQKILDKQMQ